MIESISIASIATYGTEPERLQGLSQFNYFFGSNGTGKTTISRLIHDESQFPTCNVSWKGGTKLQPMVYNQEFVERNFNQPSELKGVFTLGENLVDKLAEIASAKRELDSLTSKIEGLRQSLEGGGTVEGKKKELAILDAGLKDKCWAQKQKHDAKLQGAFEGYRGSSEKFKGKILQELDSNTAILISQAELEKRAESVFGSSPVREPFVATINAANLLAHEANPILKKRVIGKEDVDIALMIKKLGNSDWVRQGRKFYEANENICPFCQQSTEESFAKSLEEYFDETFIKDSNAIDDLVNNYSIDADRIRQQISLIISTPSKFLNVEALKVEKELLEARITINNQLLAGKVKEASQVIELESIGSVIDGIKSLIDAANILVDEHNKVVDNLSTERATLTEQIWKFILEELRLDLVAYRAKKGGLDAAINSMKIQIERFTADKQKKTLEIRELERNTTSIQPTIDGINELLLSFGFQSFKLAKSESGTSYKLLRLDGSDAKTTLSEGEKTFVTFLYFFHLLKGSEADSGMTTDRIVVFDDPISSLDSDVLFIVSSLIKGLFNEIRMKKGHIKQVFILTHNVYFHKEVTFNPDRRRNAMLEETFWVVRKSNNFSKIEKHNSNPIKTSYELLWAEVKRSDRSNLTIQNTLRRIIENYFKILGGIDPDKIGEMFEGKEKLICKSLFSWVNDGSHFAHDDLYISVDDSTVENYLKVFKKIFEKSDHLAHYRMMMGDAFEESSNDPVIADAEPAKANHSGVAA
ncbi:MAG: AAA family ATPase [Comamonas sp.]|jgi:wobble nucleotide-excising tRNase|uniref:AAA family ATPase n=1 Tax=Comamonas sp. TaxID=34028 RepID=UPI00283EEF9F|nr:AAA family ATPase [Comamonas sp.]MDR3064270.1 AAA family ATPase [Comamonas sp.]